MTEHETAMTNFKELISGDTPVLVDFYATWCGPCQMMHPVLEQLKDSFGDSIRIVKLDIESRKNIKIVQLYRVRSVPTLMLFSNGQLLWREAGAHSLEQLTNIIKQHTQKEIRVS